LRKFWGGYILAYVHTCKLEHTRCGKRCRRYLRTFVA